MTRVGAAVGALVFGLAVSSKPEPDFSAIAALTGPSAPPGWSVCHRGSPG